MKAEGSCLYVCDGARHREAGNRRRRSRDSSHPSEWRVSADRQVTGCRDEEEEEHQIPNLCHLPALQEPGTPHPAGVGSGGRRRPEEGARRRLMA